jgi:hypothetical protein
LRIGARLLGSFRSKKGVALYCLCGGMEDVE